MENDLAAARQLLEESLSISKQIGNFQGVCCATSNLGAVTFEEGDYKTAIAHFTEAIALGQKLGNKVSVSYSLDGFAALAVKKGNLELAAQLAGAAERLRESLGFDTEPAERRFRAAYLADLHAAIDEETFSKVYEQGRALRLEKAILLTLGLTIQDNFSQKENDTDNSSG
jgi:tetratricopeptide (TPR) repeat protein